MGEFLNFLILFKGCEKTEWYLPAIIIIPGLQNYPLRPFRFKALRPDKCLELFQHRRVPSDRSR